MFFILEEVKETILDFSQATVRVLWMYLHNKLVWFNRISIQNDSVQ